MKCAYKHFIEVLTCIFLFSLGLEENPKIMGNVGAYATLFPGSSRLSSIRFLLMTISNI